MLKDRVTRDEEAAAQVVRVALRQIANAIFMADALVDQEVFTDDYDAARAAFKGH